MGAAALAADASSVCLPLVVGSAVGSACGSAQERCGQRICVVEAPLASASHCAGGTCVAPEAPCTVSVAVHTAEVVQGVVGRFAGNEPVLGVRARALPYTQAIGRPAGPPDSLWPAPPAWGRVLGNAPAIQCYVFGDMRFTLPDMLMHDEVVIAFGTRTVLRLPLGAINAPLDFALLGSVSLRLGRLLESPQPVEVLVPIRPPGESLPQVARVSLSFRTATASPAAAQGAVAPLASGTTAVAPGAAAGHGFCMAEDLRPCDTADVEHEIRALEEQLRRLKALPLAGTQRRSRAE